MQFDLLRKTCNIRVDDQNRPRDHTRNSQNIYFLVTFARFCKPPNGCEVQALRLWFNLVTSKQRSSRAATSVRFESRTPTSTLRTPHRFSARRAALLFAKVVYIVPCLTVSLGNKSYFQLSLYFEFACRFLLRANYASQ